MDNVFNIGVIGCGGIAQKAHFPTIDKFSNLSLFGVCDVDLRRAEIIKNQYKAQIATKNYKDLLAIDKIDAFHICTPNFMHAPIAIDCLNAGKHVLIEKPIGLNSEEAKEIFACAKKNNKYVMSANCYRFLTEGQMLKKFIAEDMLGDIYYSRIQALRRRGIPPHGNFTNKKMQGGGSLIDTAIHLIDLAVYLLGNPDPISVYGAKFTKIGNTKGHAAGIRGQWNPDEYDVEDFACGMVRFSNGHVMSIESSFAANVENDKLNISLLGSKGGADLQPLKIYTEHAQIMTDITPVLVPPTNFYEVEIKGFYNAIINKTQTPVTQAETMNVIKIIEGLYKSAETGKEVILD